MTAQADVATPKSPPIDPDRKTDDSAETRRSPIRDTLADALKHIEETVGHVRILLTVQKDRIAAGYRRTVAAVVIGAVVGVAVITATIVSVPPIVSGVVDGMSSLFPGREWLGRLLGGSLVLGIILVGIRFVLWRQSVAHLRKQQIKYERLRNQHVERHVASGPNDETPAK